MPKSTPSATVKPKVIIRPTFCNDGIETEYELNNQDLSVEQIAEVLQELPRKFADAITIFNLVPKKHNPRSFIVNFCLYPSDDLTEFSYEYRFSYERNESTAEKKSREKKDAKLIAEKLKEDTQKMIDKLKQQGYKISPPKTQKQK